MWESFFSVAGVVGVLIVFVSAWWMVRAMRGRRGGGKARPREAPSRETGRDTDRDGRP